MSEVNLILIFWNFSSSILMHFISLRIFFISDDLRYHSDISRFLLKFVYLFIVYLKKLPLPLCEISQSSEDSTVSSVLGNYQPVFQILLPFHFLSFLLPDFLLDKCWWFWLLPQCHLKTLHCAVFWGICSAHSVGSLSSCLHSILQLICWYGFLFIWFLFIRAVSQFQVY